MIGQCRFNLHLIFFILLIPSLSAQIRHDNIWLMSDGNGAVKIDFSSGSPEVDTLSLPIEFEKPSSTICDAEGRLVYYTNGCAVYNPQNQLLPNGDTLNPGAVYNQFCNVEGSNTRGYPGTGQTAVSIPGVGKENEYFFIHRAIDFFEEPVNGERAGYLRLYLTTIRAGDSSAIDSVLSKNVLIGHRFAEGEILLDRHANGVDWWLVSPLADTNQFAVYLIDSSGILLSSIQEIGITDNRFSRGGGQSVFNPLGNKFIRFNSVAGLQLFDFDRETGQLSNHEFIPSPIMGNTELLAGGVGLSPSGQFAYVSTVFEIYQYDLWSEDIAASEVLVGRVENPTGMFIAPTAFNFQLGPDCRLYAYNNSGDSHHVIHKPDEQGLACEWEQGWLQLPFPVFRDMPYFPNYRLGPVGNEGERCVAPIVDAVESDRAENTVQVGVYPNPTAGSVTLSVQGISGSKLAQWQLFDGLGRIQFSRSLRPGASVTINDLKLPGGIYFWRVRMEDQVVDQGKLVVESR